MSASAEHGVRTAVVSHTLRTLDYSFERHSAVPGEPG